MQNENTRSKKIYEEDRYAEFSVETYNEEGHVRTEEVVAFGDGETIPYRATMKKDGFALASPLALISPHSTVTALNQKNLGGLTGAMLARQSRAPGTVVDVLVNEFIVTTQEESEKIGVPIGELKTKKLDEIIERILLQYGDDSVQELETATVLFNSVSNLASKIIEDRRLGSFIEQSSRYIVYTDRDALTGKWAYYRPARVMASSLGKTYERVLDKAFSLYATLVQELTRYYETLKPLADAEYAIKPGDKTLYKLDALTDEKERKEFNRIYKFDLKTRACDTARVVLPAATLTNLAMVANGRTFEHTLKHLYSHKDMEEYQDIALRLHETLNKLIPKYVKRALPEGDESIISAERIAKEHVEKYYPEFLVHTTQATSGVQFLAVPKMMEGNEKENMAHILAASYFPFVNTDYQTLYTRLLEETRETLLERVSDFFKERTSRRSRAQRAWEHGYECTFEVVADFGVFRDLHRHRMLSQQRQYLSPHQGFSLPEDIKKIGRAGDVWALLADVRDVYDAMCESFGMEVAQYCVLFGNHIRFMMGFSLREAQHLLELRTIPQGHPNYRKICQDMTKIIHERAPWLEKAGLLSFVDFNEYPWARAASEARQSQKMLEKGLV